MGRVVARATAITFALLSLPATAQSLRGQWRVDMPAHPDYVGAVLIDAEGRVTFDSPQDNGRPAQFRGYIQQRSAGIQMALTNGSRVAFMYCASETNDRLQCYITRADGSKSEPFILVRVGRGPQSLMQAHQ